MLLHARRSPQQAPFAIAPLLLALAVVGTYPCTTLAAAAQQAHPQSTALFEQGTAALRSGDLNTAGDDFQQATKLAPTFAEGFLNLGLVREEQGQHQAAITALERAVMLKPTLRGANLFLGIAEYRLDHFDKAAAALKRETKLNPADAHAWMWLGVDDLAAKHLEDAVDALDRAAKLSPDDLDILYHRGHALLLLSRQSYQHMFDVDPNSWRVHQVLAQGFAESDRDLDAVAEYRQAVAAAPAEPGLHASLATELWKSGQMTEATAEYRKELAIDPNDTLARYQLGCL
ncbi:MAG: tetratricopeptide repeat protein, partial [Acidobacteria bacterium]|nr:tetratricopeptide repeat protein [Acidobacteriota bacterium]